MRIGLINQLHGSPEGPVPAPTWDDIAGRAEAAEKAGFDMFVFEDALLYRGRSATHGVWESVSIAAALAAVTSEIGLGQSVINSPYRSPAMTAKIAETIDEISGGRYVLGIGAGNTADSDYAAFGVAADRRYSRFAEAIQIIHGLLKEGEVDFEGEFYSAKNAELVLRGPRSSGPPINVAAGGPKMLALAARYGDAWNWWGYDMTRDEVEDHLRPVVRQLDAACESEGRDPASLEHTLDLYTVVPEPFRKRADESPMTKPITGTPEEISGFILSLSDLGFDEVRCDVWPKTTEAVEAMEPVVDRVHAG
jgi:alkanesulfonate monooxygenase SsuD/methylene tetrahydromethanopterin reductase-like flavin-dependent oxidoreductase (luciferase family)